MPASRLSIFLLELYVQFYDPTKLKDLLGSIQISVSDDDWANTLTEWSMFILFSITKGCEGNFADIPEIGEKAVRGFFEEMDGCLLSGGITASELPHFHKELRDRITEYDAAWHSASDSSVVEKLGCAIAQNVLGIDPYSSPQAAAFGKSAVSIFLGPARALNDLRKKVKVVA